MTVAVNEVVRLTVRAERIYGPRSGEQVDEVRDIPVESAHEERPLASILGEMSDEVSRVARLRDLLD